MQNLLRPLLACAALLGASGPAPAAANLDIVAPPPGFDNLAYPQKVMLDVYFGGRKIGEALAVTQPGLVQFTEPKKVLAMLPKVQQPSALEDALFRELPANLASACSPSNAGNCGQLAPDFLGLILDENNLRVDVFINPVLLSPTSEDNIYLPTPTAPPSLATSIGFAISGSSSSSANYNVQNRTIAAFRNIRLRTDSSFASGLGLIVDDFVAEVDQPDRRYSAGLFWAPGLDFTGQRRIFGLGVGSQFDTRAKESLSGTPLVLFLARPARVEVLVDGRLIGSRSYDAGSTSIDTSGFPDGSYQLVLRIQDAAGIVREERRFFVKNSRVAPLGHPIYYAYAGLLANTQAYHPISFSKTLFYQAGVAYRLRNSIAIDVGLLGTQNKTIIEAGAWLLTDFMRLRAAGILSNRGDRGLLLQGGSSKAGVLSLNFDLRRIWSRDDKPLIPLPLYVNNFGSTPPTGAQVGEGSYTQVTGSIGYRLGSAFISIIGSLRKDGRLRADYNIGPNVDWQIANRHGLQLTLQANAQRTRTTTAAFAGFRLLFTRRGYSLMSTMGRSSISSRDDSDASKSRAVSNMVAQYSFEGPDKTQASLGAGIERNLDGTTLNANGLVYSRFGAARGDIAYALQNGATRYGLTFQSGAALTTEGAAVGGRDLQESAVIAAVEGDADSSFEVLIDGQPRGQLKPNSSLPIFLQPYRSYELRLRALNSGSAFYDDAPRRVTLYPGNVQRIRWQVENLIPVYGRAVLADGRPVRNAMIRSRRGIGQSDENGYFQIEVGQNDVLAFATENGSACRVQLKGLAPHKEYEPIGEVTCQ